MRKVLPVLISLVILSLTAIACAAAAPMVDGLPSAPMVDASPGTPMVDAPPGIPRVDATEPPSSLRELKSDIATALDTTNPHKRLLHVGTSYRFQGAIETIASIAVHFDGGDYTLTCDSRSEKELLRYDNRSFVDDEKPKPSSRWVNQVIGFEAGDVVVAEGKYYKRYHNVHDEDFYVLSGCHIVERFVPPQRSHSAPAPRTLDINEVTDPELKDAVPLPDGNGAPIRIPITP